MPHSATTIVRSIAIAALVGSLAVSPALHAATAKAPASSQSSAELSPEARVEKRIQELHDKLKITEEQSPAWNAVADTMRSNEMNTHALIQERQEKAETNSAIEDLESYQKITANHTENLGKFIQVFQPLYDAMPYDQKKNADVIFATYKGYSGRRGHASSK